MAYTYDNDSRVSGITYTAGGTQLGNLSYSYDADGRRTAVGGSLAAVNLPAAVSGNTFNADNGMTGFNGTTLSYDASGNLTSDGTNTYTWDARHHLTAISGAATASFVYDALGRRMSKTVNGVTTQFLYDGLNPVQELNASNGVTANLLTGLGIDQYFTRTDSSGTMAFLRDALGSTIGLVNSAGSIGTSYTGACPERSRREPFGNTSISGSSANAFQFTGRENDGTGLYYFRARYYDPTLQRFIAQDPWDFIGGGPNLYEYTAGDPIDLRDPSGNEVIVALLIVGRAAIGGFFGASAAVTSYYLSGGCSRVGAAWAGAAGFFGGALATSLPGGAVAIGAAAGALGPAAGEWGSASSVNPWAIIGGSIGGATGGGFGGLVPDALATDLAGGAITGFIKFPFANVGAPLGAAASGDHPACGCRD